MGVFLFAGAGLCEDENLSIELPQTFDRVWYRGGKNGEAGGKKRTGDLTITSDALEFSSPKEQAALPLDSIRAVSLGRITGDVDTDWIVVSVGPPGARRLVSFRDGAKLGFGKRTSKIHRTIREVLRQARAGPYDAPDGFETYDALASQFTLFLPAGWTARHETSVEVEGRRLWGRTVFSEPEAPVETKITLDRREALAGMRCSGFTKSADRALVTWFEEDPLLASARDVLEAPTGEPFPLGDCIARRLRARVHDADGSEMLLDARAVSDDRTLFLFILRSRPQARARALELFDRVVASFQPAVAW